MHIIYKYDSFWWLQNRPDGPDAVTISAETWSSENVKWCQKLQNILDKNRDNQMLGRSNSHQIINNNSSNSLGLCWALVLSQTLQVPKH